ncbi:MAG: hypothetical protein JO144_02155 [Actinobacteria bacterium]|nr:hypothetical protein [Actinomycetota bacterium]
MPGHLSDDSVRRVVDLLERQFGATVDRTVVTSHVVTAVRDLRGSISLEALPEMACRLAGHRLAELLSARQDDSAGRVLATSASRTGGRG